MTWTYQHYGLTLDIIDNKTQIAQIIYYIIRILLQWIERMSWYMEGKVVMG
jgi:hypothetical protein